MGCPLCLPAREGECDVASTAEKGDDGGDIQTSFKCVVVGDDGVGKTSLLIRYVTNVFPKENVPPRFDPYTTTLDLGGSDPISWSLWDTVGTDQCDQTRPSNYQNADVFLVCFSLVDPASLDHVKTKWVPEVTQHCPGVPVVMLGTMKDLRDDPQTVDDLKEKGLAPVSHSEASDLAGELGALKYVECSALDNDGVRAAFDEALAAAIG